MHDGKTEGGEDDKRTSSEHGFGMFDFILCLLLQTDMDSLQAETGSSLPRLERRVDRCRKGFRPL